MLRDVLWSEYIIGLLVLLTIYYLFVMIKYYRKEIKDIASGKLLKRKNKETSMEDDTIEELEAVLADLSYAILDKAGKGADKQQLLQQLKQRLANYAGLRKPAFRFALNNAIIKEAKETCGVAFSEEELNAAWDELLRT